MDQETVSALKNWFEGYVRSFQSGSAQHRLPIELKAEHTRRVCGEVLDIGKSLFLSAEELCLAEVMALLHDVGRFEQYARYRTFSDYKSENHATLGLKVLHKHAVLTEIERSERNLIFRVIGYHNRLSLPARESEKCLLFARLLRDADKVDIWRVFTDYYRTKDGARSGTIELDLPDTPEISNDACKDLSAGRIVKLESIKTLNDFKVLQMSWIYDINFRRTFQIVRERDYMTMLRDALPESPIVLQAYSTAQSYLEKHCRELCTTASLLSV